MNTRTLAIVLFLGWSALCWRWYVCRIKGVCAGSETAASSARLNTSEDSGIAPIADSNATNTTTQEPSSTEQISSNTAALPKSGSQNASKTLPETQPISPSKMDEVQIERVQDRMVIHFPYNSVRREDNQAIASYLARLAEQLTASKESVTITGHTDFVGEPKENVQFGLKRAASIKDALVKLGVSPKQIKCYSKGDTKPIATNDTPLGRYKNRRVEIRVGK